MASKIRGERMRSCRKCETIDWKSVDFYVCGRIASRPRFARGPVSKRWLEESAARKWNNNFFFFSPPPLRPARINDAEWRLWETFVPLPQNLSVSGHRSQEYASVLVVFCFVTPIPVFSTPLATEFRLEKCAAPHHSGNECFFFLFSFLPRIKVELIRQTSLQWFRASSWRKFFASRNRNCRNFYDFYDNRTISRLGFQDRWRRNCHFSIVYYSRIEIENNDWLSEHSSFISIDLMSLIFRKFWKLCVRKEGTNRDIKLTRLLERLSRSNVRLLNHFAALLHQIGL